MYFCIINTLLMKKKLMTIALALLTTLGAHAQFEKDKAYVGASLTGLDLSYNGTKKLNLGLQADAGYFLVQDWIFRLPDKHSHPAARRLVPDKSKRPAS